MLYQNGQKIILGVFVGIISVILFTPQILLQTSTADVSSLQPIDDSIGNLKIKAVFHFNKGVEEVNSFKVFNQMSGFQSTEPIKLTLWGGVGPDKPLLYYATDMTYQRRNMPNPDFGEFDMDVYIQKDDIVFRELSYSDCKVSDYSVSTLHDNDETFSGKTKFVYADVFEFECKGYMPSSPTYES